MRREIPLAITFVVGILYVLSNAVQIQIGSFTLAGIIKELNAWVLIVSAFAMGLASVNLVLVHSQNIAKRKAKWGHSALMIGSFVVTASVGILATTFRNATFIKINDNIFNNIQAPLGATMWAMVGFFICSSAYRAFRLRSFEASLMLVAGILVMLGRAPVGEVLWKSFPTLANWLLNVPNTAGQRAIMIGAAVGGFTTALRIILGKDKGYLGGAE